MPDIIPLELIKNRIFLIRGKKVMLSTHLSELYEVEHKTLMQSVKRNMQRFPEDFMFQLNKQELRNLRSQIVTANIALSKIRYNPYAFTEQGVAMLSSVLRSDRAVEVNIQIMRTFVKIREILLENNELSRRLDELENKYDRQFTIVFKALEQMIPPVKKKEIGFKPGK